MRKSSPCKHHNIAFPNDTMPEVIAMKQYRVFAKCMVCGWHVLFRKK